MTDAEIDGPHEEEALKLCEPPGDVTGRPHKPTWQDDADLLTWLASL